jgi:hypothetical protein
MSSFWTHFFSFLTGLVSGVGLSVAFKFIHISHGAQAGRDATTDNSTTVSNQGGSKVGGHQAGRDVNVK